LHYRDAAHTGVLAAWRLGTTAPPQRNRRRQCLGVRRCYDVRLGRYWESKDTRKRIKLALIIYRDFMQTVFSNFERRRDKINRKQLEP